MRRILIATAAISLLSAPAFATNNDFGTFRGFGTFGTFGGAAALSSLGGEARAYGDGSAGVRRDGRGVSGWQTNDAGAFTDRQAWALGGSVGVAQGGFADRPRRGSRDR